MQKWICIFVSLLGVQGLAAQGRSWESFGALEQAAYFHNLQAQEDLASYYMAADKGKEAFVWFKKASKRGSALGLYGLGFCYETGRCGKAVNLKKAFKYYVKAAKQEHPESLYAAARYLYEGPRPNIVKAVEYIKRAAEAGHAPAQEFLANAYYSGQQKGIDQDYAQAAYYWRKLAESGDVNAYFNLGHLYYNGYGMPNDFKQAFEWDMKAAQAGMAEGMFQVGQAYWYGEGVEEDPVEAAKWLEKAAEKGYAPAKKMLDNMDYYIYRGPKLPGEKGGIESVFSLKKRAEQGDAKAQYMYGSLCAEQPLAVEENCDPVYWLRLAAAQGIKPAQELLNKFNISWD